MICFNCIEDCPPDSIEIRFQVPRKEKRTRLDISRRQFTGSLLTGIFTGIIARKSAFTKQKIHPFVRPPGSVGEEDFLKKCIRCGQCMQICPTNFIQPALFETGVDGIWTPVLNARLGYCDYECKKCLEICPTDAIEDMPLEDKKTFKIGTAVIDRDRCYTYADGYNCAVCEEHCPVPDKAIKYRRVKVWNFEGKLVEVNQIYVVPDLCNGCGNCEHVCPRSDVPAIVLGAEEEQREFSFF
jgi:MauM/NapG family ferredoxin protein